MYKRLFPFGIGLLALLRLVDLTPIQIRRTEHTSTAIVFDVRSASDSCATDQPSVYICQNYNWEPPCLNCCLGPSQNNQQLFWIAPAPGGPGPYQDYNWTIGSWGPSNGVTTYWVDQEDNKSEWCQYPGTGQVDDYWKQNIWTWYAFWDQ